MPRQAERKYDVDVDDVEAAVETLRDEGRTFVKSRDVATKLGLPENNSAHSLMGQYLERADDGLVTPWNDPVSGSMTWEIHRETAQEVSA